MMGVMIRTRDFVLFIIVVLFLLFGIGTTLIYEKFEAASGSVARVVFNQEAVVPEVAPKTEIDERAANIARLKEKLKEGSEISVPDIDTVVTPPPPPAAESVTNRTAIYCPTLIDRTELKAKWSAKTAVREVEGARMVYESVMQVASTASGTSAALNETPRLQLSLSQVRESQDSCLTSDVIGVTTTGALLTNDAAVRYQGVSELTLIGFALDGLPIYGMRTDTSRLDNCGGESGPLGYRYYLRSGENFMLGCFAGSPTNFIN